MMPLSVRTLLLACSAALLLPAAPAVAQDQTVPQDQDDQHDQQDMGSIVVTGMRVRQGGAQDIRHFRSIAADEGMPRPESLTVEGLLGEHDLTLPAATDCAQLFCVVGEAMPANFALRSADRLFVGLGFASNIDEKSWHRAPLNLVAVVDKSGSMDGQPLSLVRASLLKILGQMDDGDRMSIVLYGDTSAVYLQPTDVRDHREAIERAIRGIASEGSTDMESGLRVGYDTAFTDAPGFKGNTRLMLFTDEQPNVGRTDAESFIGMAEAASKRGIGLTTIGVGVQFDAGLATQVSSTRGGNLFFISDEKTVGETFDKQLDTMVSELAHDLVLTMKPAPGYRISGVFGVPDGTMTETAEGSITVTVPTVFLSTNGGGIFATLAGSADRADLPLAPIAAGQPLLQASVTWNDARDGKPGSDTVAIAAPAKAASAPLRQANLLVDEYLALREASTAYHERNDPKAAYAVLTALAGRLKGSGLPGMGQEEKLVADMTQRAGFYAGYGGEPPRSIRHLAVVGRWQVTSVNGFEDIAAGDKLVFTPDREMETYYKKTAFDDGADDTEPYEINEREIHLVGSHLVLAYSARGDRMSMSDPATKGWISLRRVD